MYGVSGDGTDVPDVPNSNATGGLPPGPSWIGHALDEDVTAATECGVAVSNIPNYCTQEVASHAIALMPAVSHEVVRADNDLREADGGGERPPNRPLYDGTLGAIGLGRIGRSAARKARGFGMDSIAYDPYRTRTLSRKRASRASASRSCSSVPTA